MYTTDNTLNYWNKKYSKQQRVWGIDASNAAKHAGRYLEKISLKNETMLDLGCGYGRDAAFFHQRGFEVTGIDIASEGIRMAKSTFSKQIFKVMDFHNHAFDEMQFGLIFANYFFHLITDSEKRQKFIERCHQLLKLKGILFASFASTKDHDFQSGVLIGTNMIKNSRNVTKLYYDPSLIHREFKDFNILELTAYREDHLHDEPHSHESYLAIIQRAKN